MVDAVALQRVPTAKPPPATSDVDQRLKVLEVRQKSSSLDQEYLGRFNERLAGYRQSIYRITGAFQDATNQFQAAQRKQLEVDTIRAQVFATIVASVLAAGFEPFMAGLLGGLGTKLETLTPKLKKIVEAAENPVNAATAGGAGVGAAVSVAGSTEDRQAPANVDKVVAGDPLTFLTANLDVVEQHNQKFAKAFADRAAAGGAAAPEEVLKWDLVAQRATYDAMLAELDKIASPTPDKLVKGGELSKRIEKLMWAAWINSKVPAHKWWEAPDSGDFGGEYIEQRLNALGVSGEANVHLSGTWWDPNSPSFWKKLLVEWSDSFSGWPQAKLTE